MVGWCRPARAAGGRSMRIRMPGHRSCAKRKWGPEEIGVIVNASNPGKLNHHETKAWIHVD
jgi:hypothetical protein